MPNTDVNRKFVSYGTIALILAILEIVFLIFTILFLLGIRILAPFMIGALIGIMIFRFIGFRFLNKANKILKDHRLNQFISKIYPSTIFFLIGNIIFMVGINGLANWAIREDNTIPQLAALIFTTIIGISFLFISGLIEYQAWDRLEMFFSPNQSSFPPSIAKSGSNGATLLKIGGLLNIFIVLIVVGSILRIIGFFLMLSLKNLKGEQPVSVAQPAVATQPPPSPAAESAKRFCPNCGSTITGEEKFCGACGSGL